MFYVVFRNCKLLQIDIITFLQQIAFVSQNGIRHDSTNVLIVFQYILAYVYDVGIAKSY